MASSNASKSSVYRALSSGKSPRRAPVLSQPPPLSLSSNVTNIHLRDSFAIYFTDVEISYKLMISDLLFMQEDLLKVFAEYRLIKVDIWYQPAVPITETGLHTLAVIDEGLNYLSVPNFVNIASAPGSHTARSHETLCGTWFPTNPESHNWLPVTDTTGHVRVYYARDLTPLISGSFVIDTHVSLRGFKPHEVKFDLSQYQVWSD